MKQIAIIIFLLFLALCPEAVSGKDFVLDVGDFVEIKVEDNLSVEYHCNPEMAGKVFFSAEQAVADRIMLNNNSKGKLNIGLVYDERKNVTFPKLTVYSSHLEAAINEGKGVVEVMSNVPSKKFKAKISENGSIIVHDANCSELLLEVATGNGRVWANGKCEELRLYNLGSGTIEATKVGTGKVMSRIFGTGSVRCNVSDGGTINLKGSGSGKLYYGGKPAKVTVKKLGSVKAIPLSDQ